MNSKIFMATLVAFVSQPAWAQYVPPKQETTSPLGVDLATAKFTFQNEDLSIGPFQLERSYRGQNPDKVPSKWFGPDWSHNYDIFVREGSGQHFDDTYIAVGRRIVTFSKANGAFYASAAGEQGDSLTRTGNNYVFTNRNGDVYTFASGLQVATPNTAFPNSARVSAIAYANGHHLDFIYASSLLVRVVSNYGYALVFEYNGSGNVSKACVFNQTVLAAASTCTGALASTSYSYATVGGLSVLVDVQDRLGQHWGYDYSNDVMNLSCVRLVNSSNCRVANSYLNPSKVSRQVDANGGVWDYNIDANDADSWHYPGQAAVTTSGAYSGPAGTSVSVNFADRVVSEVISNSRAVRVDMLDELPSRLTYPEGNSVTYNYDAYYNKIGESWTPKPGSGLAVVSNTAGYATVNGCVSIPLKICYKPTYRTDYRNNRTDYTWDQNSGQVLTESAPADSNGIRAVKRSAYVQRYAWISNGAGGYVQTAWPIWLLASEKTCRATATSGDACTGGAADETVTTYDYGPDSGPNNLMLRGVAVTASGVTLRTCYGYDAMGNRIWETKARAGLTQCQ